MELTESQGIVRKELLSGKTLYCSLYFGVTPMSNSLVVAFFWCIALHYYSVITVIFCYYTYIG